TAAESGSPKHPGELRTGSSPPSFEPILAGCADMVAAPSHSELTIVAVGVTDAGPQRQHNEDAVLLRPDLHLYAVADGAGGPNAGNVASAVGLMTLATYVESSRADATSRPPIDELGLYVGARRLSI